MKNFLLFLFLVGFYQISTAQYTDLINSKRPGFSDSPFSVGTDVYQIEAGLFYKNIGNYLFFDNTIPGPSSYKSKVIGTDITIRTSKFLEKLELNLDLNFVYEDRDYILPTADNISKLGLSRLTIGAKYLVYSPKYTDKSKEIRSWKKRTSYDWKRLIPAVGVYAGLNTNFLSSLHKNPEGLSPRVAVFTQSDITDRFVVLVNLIADKLFTDESENSYILTATYTLNRQFSVFAENQGFLRKSVPNDFQYGLGGAYLMGKNMQVDASVRFISDERGDDSFFFGAGFAYRIDRHEDKYKLIGADGEVNSDDDEKKGGFFSRLFGKKEKGLEKRKVKKVKAKKRKIIKDKAPKKTKAQKKREKAALKKLKEDQKAAKKKAKDYDKNYEPPSN